MSSSAFLLRNAGVWFVVFVVICSVFSLGSAGLDILRRGNKLTFFWFISSVFLDFYNSRFLLILFRICLPETQWSHQMKLGPEWPFHSVILDSVHRLFVTLFFLAG